MQEPLINLRNGIDVKDSEGHIFGVKGLLICLSCDIPACSAILNMNQHNGDSRFPKCLQTGVNTRRVAGGYTRTFPCNAAHPSEPERTCAQVVEDGIQANETKEIVNGNFIPHVCVKKLKWFKVLALTVCILFVLGLGLSLCSINKWTVILSAFCLNHQEIKLA